MAFDGADADEQPFGNLPVPQAPCQQPEDIPFARTQGRRHGAWCARVRNQRFGGGHLFIDDCPDGTMTCNHGGEVVGTIANGEHDGFCYSYAQCICVPCAPWMYGINGPDEMKAYWRDQCNSRFKACNGDCGVGGFCTEDAPLGNTLCT